MYEWQDDTPDLILMTDSDWANDARSRKSHSGGLVLRGGHLITHWCRIQSVIALSSAEAELYAGVCGLVRLIGILNLGQEVWGDAWGRPVHRVDASACKGILLRKGAGSVKHLETKSLWVQEAIKRRGIVVEKVAREENPADSLASFSPPATLSRHLEMLNCRVFYLDLVKS